MRVWVTLLCIKRLLTSTFSRSVFTTRRVYYYIAFVQHNWSSGEIIPSSLSSRRFSLIGHWKTWSGSLPSGRISVIVQLSYVQQLNYVLPPSQNSDFNHCVSEVFCFRTTFVWKCNINFSNRTVWYYTNRIYHVVCTREKTICYCSVYIIILWVYYIPCSV